MREVRLLISEGDYTRLCQHLLPTDTDTEQAAFLLCAYAAAEGAFNCEELILIRPRQFEIRSAYHLELDDTTRGQVIKAAHDRQCSLVEAHSHPFSSTARFSGSDFDGLAEFVPHVWWRLRHRPYAALVFTPRSVDGLAWIDGPAAPVRLAVVQVGDRTIQTTGLSFEGVERDDDEQIRQE